MKTKSRATLRRTLAVAVCVLLALVASVRFFLGSTSLRHEGVSIDRWLARFDSPSELSPDQWQERLRGMAEATEALRQMGPDVFPHLRRMLQPDSGTAKFVDELRRELRREHTPAGSVVAPSREEVRMLRAVEACAALGHDAQAMIPDLVAILGSNSPFNVRSRAAYALGEIGGAPETVVPALLQSLSSRADGNVLITLGKFGTDADIAVPAIASLLDDLETSVLAHKPIDKGVLYEAARALHRIKPREAEKTLPLLRAAFEEEPDLWWRSRWSEVFEGISGTPIDHH